MNPAAPMQQPGPSQEQVGAIVRCFDARDLAAAERLALQLRESHPAHPFAWKALGAIYKLAGRLEESLAQMRESVRLAPDDAEAHNNLGLTFRNLDRLAEAEASCREAVRLQPGLAAAHDNLGVILKHMGRLSEAEACHREAIRLSPRMAGAYTNLGVALRDQGRLSESEAACREALRLDPSLPEAHSNLLFSMNYIGSRTPLQALEDAKRYGAMASARAHPKFSAWHSRADPGVLRVGLVSGDLRSHPVGYFVEGLVQPLDRTRFELHAFPTAPNADALTARIRPSFKSWTPLQGLTDSDAARAIHDRGIQVLLDLSGHTAHNRLGVFAHRPAPVQASWLGYFASTGLPEMDYVLGDPVMSPPSEQAHFTERIWNLPDAWLCMTPPRPAVPVSPLPALANGFITFGGFGNLAKMNDAVVETWSAVLRGLPSARLFLKSVQLADPRLADETRNRFARNGIDAGRLSLEGPSPRQAYFEAYSRVDIALDTFPYPGGTTSVEALWMGVPVLTCRGSSFLSRLGESIATHAGQAGWIARDRDDFVARALALAAVPAQLAQLRNGLRAQVLRTPLFDAGRFGQGFGEALWGMWSRQPGPR